MIAVGTYDGSRLPFVIHNNTETGVERVSVQGTVMDETGTLFAVGGDQGIDPGRIEPGAVGVGYLYFEGIAFPVGATVDMAVSFRSEETRSFTSSLVAAVAEWNQVDDRIIGFLSNPHPIDIIEPISVTPVCLSEDGSVVSFNQSYTESPIISVEDEVPFQVTLSNVSCDHILIIADGWDF